MRNLPFGRKLLLLAGLASGLSLVVACAAFVIYDVITFRQFMVKRVSTEADILGKTAASALVFNDPEFAGALLDGLDAEPSTISACIFDSAGAVFASYTRDGEGFEPPRAGDAPSHSIRGNYLDVFRPVAYEGETVGTIFIRSHLGQLADRVRRYIQIAASVLVLTFIASLMLSLSIRNAIVRPVQELVDTARAVTTDRDYSARARKYSQDELGILTDAFNDMLEQIQNRDSALRASEERFRRLAENAPDIIFRWSAGGGFEYSSPVVSQLTGYSPEELAADKDIDFKILTGEDADLRTEMEGRITTADPVQSTEVRLKHKNGTDVFFDVRAVPVTDAGGNVVAFEGIMHDVTQSRAVAKELEEYRERLEDLVEERTVELKKAQEKLIASERLAIIGQFAGSIAHEIRNPLAVIANSAYYLSLKLEGGSERVMFHIGKIRDRVESAANIIDSIMKLTRMEEPKRAPCDPEEILREVLEPSRIPDSVDVSLAMPGLPVAVLADREQLRIALKNIVKNAVQAMEADGGRLDIDVRPVTTAKGGLVQFTISDTGGGISPEDTEKIFQPLFTKKTYGIGFGLSIVKMIIDKHGGEIKVESNPDGGATFIITVPMREEGEGADDG